MYSIVLTVADHEADGFIGLAQWRCDDEKSARRLIAQVDAAVEPDAEPDLATAPFTFILDLMSGDDLLETGNRLLPMQIAARLAPEEVSRWISTRPDPNKIRNSPRVLDKATLMTIAEAS